MVFSSPAFLSLFLPAAFLLCAALRRSLHAQNVCLCVFSLLFYAWGEPVYVLLLIASALGNGWIARSIAASAKTAQKNRWTALAVFLNIGMLFVFKYAGFFVESLNSVFSLALQAPRIALPVGISFFTFQALSYVLDVRMGKSEPAERVGQVLLYLSLFPQLIAGPIVKWRKIKDQITARSMTAEGAARGLQRFVMGFAKKILLADTLARVADAAFACPPDALNAPLAWLGAVAYTLQIYLDFSGYSDMAVGMGWMFGFSFPENFRHPLRAASMADFWRRWHITLTDWFRQYLYIPLGGNRKGAARTYWNLGLVFLFTGLWHGAAWTFVLWGLWNGLFVILERAGVLKVDRWPRWIAHAYTLLVVVAGFVLFRAETVAQGVAYWDRMLLGFSMTPVQRSYLLEQFTPMNLTVLLIAILVSVGAFRRVKLSRLAVSIACIGLFMLAYAAMLASGYHPFIYFRF